MLTPIPTLHYARRVPPPPHTHRSSTPTSDYTSEALEIYLAFPEFLELIGLSSFVVALSQGWQATDAGSVLPKVQALIRETAGLGAPWVKLAQGQKLLAACASAGPPPPPPGA